MTAAPCPSVEALARDPNLCAVCGHWCGKSCAARWPSRSVGTLRRLVSKWVQETKSWGKPLDKDAFDRWLKGRTS